MRFRKSVIAAYLCACGVLLIGAAGFRVAVERLNAFVVKKPVEMRAPLATLPASLGPWKKLGDDVQFGAAMVEELGTSQYLDRTYALDGDPAKGVANVHVAYYTGAIDDVPHIPERCWDAAGMVMTRPPERMALEIDDSDWTLEPKLVNRATGLPYHSVAVRHPVTGLEERVYMPVGEIEMTVSEFRPALEPRMRQTGGYFFIANGRPTASALGVRSLAFSLTDEFAYYCKVQVTMRTAASEDEESVRADYRTVASELVSALLPHLMKRLPIWPEYEGSLPPPSGPEE